VSAVIGSFVIGKAAERVSLKKLVRLIVVGWIICLTLFVATDRMNVIWVLGSAVGILMGGLWTTTRPMLAELVPRQELGRFFGLFSLSGRAAAIFGPLLWTTIVFLFKKDGLLGPTVAELFVIDVSELVKLSYKLAVLSLVVVLLIGLYIFRKVPQTKKDPDE
jgi:UMF1 family MFS transporter